MHVDSLADQVLPFVLHYYLELDMRMLVGERRKTRDHVAQGEARWHADTKNASQLAPAANALIRLVERIEDRLDTREVIRSCVVRDDGPRRP